MKLKYYLRGMGIGIILTAIVMGFALGGRKATISDAEVIQRAKELGMIEAGTGVLTQYTGEAGTDNDKTDTSSSDTTLDQAGEEIPQEVDQTVTGTDKSVSEVAGEAQEGQDQTTEEGGSEGQSSDDDAQGSAEEEVKETDIASETTETQKTEETAASSPEETATSSATETVSAEPENVAEQETAAADTTVNSSVAGKTVSIPGGLGSESVAAILEREGLVDSASSFNRYLVENRIDRIIRSGVKTIPDGASYEQIADIITK